MVSRTRYVICCPPDSRHCRRHRDPGLLHEIPALLVHGFSPGLRLVDPLELSLRPCDRVSGRIPRSLRAILRDSGRIVKAEAGPATMAMASMMYERAIRMLVGDIIDQV